MEQNEFEQVIIELDEVLKNHSLSVQEQNDVLAKHLGFEAFHKFAEDIVRQQIKELAPPFTNYSSHDGDIISYLKDFFHRYQGYLSSFENCLERVNVCMQAYIDVFRSKKNMSALTLHFDIQEEINDVCKMIFDTLVMYYKGFPAEAYNIMEQTMTKADNHLMKLLPQLLYQKGCNMFRVRSGEHNNIKDLFHVPFEKREQCNSYRFSIAGVPALYCGASLNTSILETEISKDAEFSATRFCFNDIQSDIAFVDLALPSGRDLTFWEEYSLIVFYPLIVACGLKVRKENAFFKPEYIIPQLFYQIIRNHGLGFCGISYTSTRYDTPDFTDYQQRNFVLFVRNADEEKGYDTDLASRMEATQPQKFIYSSDEAVNEQEAELRNATLEQCLI